MNISPVSITLTEMSFFGAILILAIILLRLFFIHRLPKQAFVILWLVALLRLLLPFSAPAINVSPLADMLTPLAGHPSDTYLPLHDSASLLSEAEAFSPETQLRADAPKISGLSTPEIQKCPISVWLILYCMGLFLFAATFILSYIRLCREFRMSLPAGNAFTARWLSEHPLRRTVILRQSDRISTPLTYGIFRPVILMPKTVRWDQEEELAYILLHEHTHIRRFDAVSKLLMTAALCIHWFNPMIYVMYLLFNRDIELACDENVLRRCGEEKRAAYALTLIGMEEQKTRLSPFCSGFGKNAVEERITAIMKIRKLSLFSLLTAVFLIFSAAVIFAVSAEPELKEESPGAPTLQNHSTLSAFTEEEQEMLLSLWLDGYEDMTIRAFRDMMSDKTDTPKMLELCERYSLAEADRPAAERAASDPSGFTDYFLFIYEPLTSGIWQSHSYDGSSLSARDSVSSEQAVFKYTVFLTILDADTLTVAEYDKARREATNTLDTILDGYSLDELADQEIIYSSIKEKVAGLEARLHSKKLEIAVNYFLTPLSDFFIPHSDYALIQENLSDISDEWDSLLSPYAPFGLTWEYRPDSSGNGLTMYYQNREVCGIFDSREQLWITEHTGRTTYSAGAAELCAVYENDRLSGLRFATEEEQGEWDRMRNSSSAQAMEEAGYQENDKPEPRLYPNGTEEDYASLLILRTPDYREMSVYDFNNLLLEWCNANYERMEAIGTDADRQDYQVALTEEERYFVELTFPLSRLENARMITNLQTGKPEETIWIGGKKFSKTSPNGAWATLYYQLSYQITDKKHLTVGERDQCIEGIIAEIQNFWEDTSLKELSRMEESDIVEYLQTLAEQYSTQLLHITINSDQVQLEHRER